MKWQTHTLTGSPHKSPCEWNERVFAGRENILPHAPLQTLLLINLSALCFESNLVQPQEKHSAVSGAWLCFEGRGLLPSQSTARLCCKNTSSWSSTLASSYTPHTCQSSTGLKTSLTTSSLSTAQVGHSIQALSLCKFNWLHSFLASSFPMRGHEMRIQSLLRTETIRVVALPPTLH